MMKRILAIFALLGAVAVLTAQTPRLTPPSGSSLPANCNIGDLFTKTSATAGLYVCTASNTWSILPGAGSGTVTNTGTLTNHALIKGNGGVDVSALGSLGTTTTVFHGNASGDGSFSAVDLANDVTGNLGHSHLNSGTGASSTTFWRGDDTWAAPAGGGGTFTFVRKPSDQAVTSSTTFVNDADLTWNVGANETWVYELALVVNGASGTGRFKVQLTVPSGTTGSIMSLGPAFSANDNNGPATYAAANGITSALTFIGMAGTSRSVVVLIKGVAVSSATTGAITLQWAQNDSSATPTTVQTNSYLLATRVAP
jgi:hypothetical protein